jgi:hypothetical protein
MRKTGPTGTDTIANQNDGLSEDRNRRDNNRWVPKCDGILII